MFVASDSTLRPYASTTPNANGFAVTTGVWYRIDLDVLKQGTTGFVKLSVDGATEVSHPWPTSGQTTTLLDIGVVGPVTGDVYIDDIIASSVGWCGPTSTSRGPGSLSQSPRRG